MRMRFAFRALVAAGLVVGVAGCKEIDARRTIQQANTKYDNQKYEEAKQLYEDALEQAPDLDIGHHNLGVTYYRLMKRRDPSDENKQLALQAVEHLRFYLDRHVADDAKDDFKVRNLVSEIYFETELYEEGIAFWKAWIEKAPDQKSFALGNLAKFYATRATDRDRTPEEREKDQQAAIAALNEKVDVAVDNNDKAAAYHQIGYLVWSILMDKRGFGGIQGPERILRAEEGIAALQKGLALEPSLSIQMDLHNYLAALNQQRSIATRSKLAFEIDMANRQNHQKIWSVLDSEAKKQAEMEADAAMKGEGDAAAAPDKPDNKKSP